MSQIPSRTRRRIACAVLLAGVLFIGTPMYVTWYLETGETRYLTALIGTLVVVTGVNLFLWRRR